MLLPSLGRGASDYNEVAGALVAAGFRTIAVDGPAIGASSPLPAGATLFDLADDLVAIAGVEHIERLAVVGHAYGNRLARALATRHPGLVEQLVLIAAGGRHPIPSTELQSLTAIFSPGLTAEEHLDHVRSAFFADGNAVPDHWKRGWNPLAAAAQSSAVIATPSELWWAGGDVPILVIQGESDRIAPRAESADLLAAQFPDRVEVAIVANAGHALIPEQPSIIAQTIIDRLRRQPSPTRSISAPTA